MKILAIDPGFERVGIAVIEKTYLKNIGLEVEGVIKKYKPEALAIEKLYFATNQKTVMGVSEARGTIIYVASKNNLLIYEYTPPQIKVAVAGYGKANKDMIMSMVPKLIEIKKETNSDDELDAIAIGLTCLACEKFSTSPKLLQRK